MPKDKPMRFVRRSQPDFTFEDFYVGDSDIAKGEKPKVVWIAQKQIRSFRSSHFSMTEEDLFAEAMLTAVEVYDRMAHTRIRDLSSLYAVYTVSVRNRCMSLYRERMERLRGINGQVVEESLYHTTNEGDEVAWEPIVDFEHFEVAYNRIVEALSEAGEDLALELFHLFLGSCSDAHLQFDFQFCLLAHTEEKTVDLRRLSQTLGRHGWRFGEKAVPPDAVSRSLTVMRRCVFENLSTSVTGDVTWERSLLSRSHPREMTRRMRKK